MKQWELRGVTVGRPGFLMSQSPVLPKRRDDDRSDAVDSAGAEAHRPVRSGGRSRKER